MAKYYYQAVSYIEVDAPSQYAADQAMHRHFQKNHIPHSYQFHVTVKGMEKGDQQKYRVGLEIGSPAILRRFPEEAPPARPVGQYDTINGVAFCSDECPYLEFDQTEGWCLALNKELNFYDWFIAECVEPQP